MARVIPLHRVSRPADGSDPDEKLVAIGNAIFEKRLQLHDQVSELERQFVENDLRNGNGEPLTPAWRRNRLAKLIDLHRRLDRLSVERERIERRLDAMRSVEVQ